MAIFEQYRHEPLIAVARLITKFLSLPEERRAEYESKQEGGHKALRVMEQQLQQTPYLTGYCAVEAWLERIPSRPKYVAMQ